MFAHGGGGRGVSHALLSEARGDWGPGKLCMGRVKDRAPADPAHSLDNDMGKHGAKGTQTHHIHQLQPHPSPGLTVGALDVVFPCWMSVLRNCNIAWACGLFSSMSYFEFKNTHVVCHYFFYPLFHVNRPYVACLFKKNAHVAMSNVVVNCHTIGVSILRDHSVGRKQ